MFLLLSSLLLSIYLADGTIGGNCDANTTSGCYDVNAECKDAVCQCIVGFTDINGTCIAGKLITVRSWRLLHHFKSRALGEGLRHQFCKEN